MLTLTNTSVHVMYTENSRMSISRSPSSTAGPISVYKTPMRLHRSAESTYILE